MGDTVQSLEDLADLLGISEKKLLFFSKDTAHKSLYTSFQVPKKTGGFRTIEAPRRDLKACQRILADYFTKYYKAPKCVHGFVPGRSIKTNAECHAGKQVVVTIDLENFFPSITPNRVAGLLRKAPFNMPPEVARSVSRIVCSGRGLPQGAPSSPIIANMICRSMDKELCRISNKIGAFYTRYADDMTFSFSSRAAFKRAFLASGELSIPAEIENAITKYGTHSSFAINANKTHYSSKHSRQTVTGVTVNEKTNLPRPYYRKIRACLHRWRTEGIERATREYYHAEEGEVSPSMIGKFESVIRGNLAYYQMILGDRATSSTPLQTLGSMFNQVCTGKLFPIHRLSDSLFLLTVDRDPGPNNEHAGEYEEATAFVLEGFGIVTAKHTFDNAASVSGIYSIDLTSMLTGMKTTCNIMIDNERDHPDYDYIVIPLDEAPEELKRTPALSLADSVSIKGQTVFSYLIRTLEEGYKIDAIEGPLEKNPGRPNRYGSHAHVDAQFQHGMSGGPVFNLAGKVVGIVYSAPHNKELSKYLASASLSNIPEFVEWTSVS